MGEAYCIKCKQKQPLIEGQIRIAANGHPQEKGKCGVCNTNISRWLNKEERAALKEQGTDEATHTEVTNDENQGT